MDTSKLQIIKQRYNVVGNCDALNRALDVALQVAPTDLSVLIIGESGVGKEIIPRVIHDNSPRKREKYFAINCGSIPEGTIDSELFGGEVQLQHRNRGSKLFKYRFRHSNPSSSKSNFAKESLLAGLGNCRICVFTGAVGSSSGCGGNSYCPSQKLSRRLHVTS